MTQIYDIQLKIMIDPKKEGPQKNPPLSIFGKMKRKLHKRTIGSALRKESSSNRFNSPVFSFFIKQVCIPLFAFILIILGLLLLQFYIHDYCFYNDICACQNFGVYIYTIFGEFIHFDSLLITCFYFSNCFLIKKFFRKKLPNYIFFLMEILCFIIFFIFVYDQRHEQVLADLRFIRSILSAVRAILFIMIWTTIHKEFSKDFFKKFIKMSFFVAYYMFHGLYLKNNLSLYFLGFLHNNLDKDLAINIFKLVFMLYYIIYAYIAKSLIFSFYKDILKRKEDFPADIIITILKYINIDVYSIKVMNVLTTSLLQVYSWISFVYYIYSLLSVYLALNLQKTCCLAILKKILPNKCFINFFSKSKSQESINYDKIRSGCILEANIIIFVRIIIHYFYNYFFYITKIRDLFSDCSMKEINSVFEIVGENIIVVCCSHTGLVFCIFCFMIKTKKLILNLAVEDFSIAIKSLFFIFYFSQVDFTLQFYMILQLTK